MLLQLKRIYILFVSLFMAFLLGCSAPTSSSTSAKNNPSVNSVSSITVADAGVIPVVANQATTTLIYVHNNSIKQIDSISYQAVVALEDARSTSTFNVLTSKLKEALGVVDVSPNLIDPKSAATCGSIPAGQACPLSITIPPGQTQGSVIVTVDYIVKGKIEQINQVINYAPADTSDGVHANSGVQIHSYGNNIGYGVVYLRATGDKNLYTIDDLQINNPGFVITQGNIKGQQLQAGYVQVVEIRVQFDGLEGNAAKRQLTGVSGISADLTVKSSSLDGVSYLSSVNLGAVPSSTGAWLVSGMVPLLDSSTVATANLLVMNAGTAKAALGNISYPSGFSYTSGINACGPTIESGSYCYLYFKSTGALPSGNGTLSVTYTTTSGGNSGTLAQSVIWFNSKGGALIQEKANNDPLTFVATVGGTTTITLTNIGGYELTNLSVSNPVSASGSSAYGTSSGLNCPGGGMSLPVGQSCTYTVNLSSAVSENGTVNLAVSGTYNDGSSKTYTALFPLKYSATAYAAILQVATPSSMTIVGDNNESKTQTLTISNIGAAAGTLTASKLTNTPSYLTIITNGCASGSIAASGQCTVVVKVGPVTKQALETGSATYQVTYSGSGQTVPGSVATTSIPYNVQANTQALNLTAVTTTGTGISGSGTSATPYLLQGSVTSGQSVTFTYTNQGTNPIIVSGVLNTNSPITWVLDNSSTCIGSGGTAPSAEIAVNGSCSLVFKNVLNQYSVAVSGGLGASYTENIITPTLVFLDQQATGTMFVVQSNLPSAFGSGNTLYVTGQQATITDTVTSTPSGRTLTVAHSLANAKNYTSMTITTQMEYYFTNTGTPSAGCSTAMANGILTQTCTLLPDANGVDSESVQYVAGRGFSGQILDTLFSLDAKGQTSSLNTLSARTLLLYNQFVYAVNTTTPNIQAYTVNTTTGVLTAISGGASVTATTPKNVAIDPLGRFAYVTNNGSNNISMYKIDATTGKLSVIGSATIVAGTNPTGIAIDYSGRYVYVANTGSNTISMYSIDQTTGALTSIGSTSVSPATSPTNIVVTPNSRFVYITNASGTVSMYSINQSTINPGTLSVIGSAIAAGTTPKNIAVDPTSKYVYVTNSVTSGSVYMFSIDQITGALSAISTAAAAGKNPDGIEVDPTGKYAYVVNTTDATVQAFSINQITGALSALSSETIATGPTPSAIAIDPLGKYVYVSNNTSSGSLSMYKLDLSTGLLTSVGSPVAAGANPNGLAITAGM